jgi:hypothetical protein
MSLLKKLIKILIVIVLAYGVARFVVVFHDSRLTGYRAPYIQMLTKDSVVIHWMTEDNQLGIVRFGEDPELLSTIELESSPVKDHVVKLSGLKPATRYYYQTGTISGFYEGKSKGQWFYTNPDKVQPVRVWVIGDSGEAGETLDQVRDSALGWMQKNPLPLSLDASIEASDDKSSPGPLINVWLALGDIAYRSGTNDQYQAALFEPYGKLMSNTSLWPVYGNHDDRRWTYFRIFDLPENAEAGGIASHTENYYSIDYSNIHFVILDSQDSDRSADGDMANWLRRDLAHNKKPWVIAAFHHPPYTKGSHNSDNASDSRGRMKQMRENIVPVLEAGGVDLVLSGHSHMYERSHLMDCSYGTSKTFSASNIVSTGEHDKDQQYLKPLNEKKHQGTVYVVAGSSSKVDRGELNHPALPVGLLEAGSMVIDVNGDKLTARFINKKGQIRDEFSITKQADYSSGYQGCVD